MVYNLLGGVFKRISLYGIWFMVAQHLPNLPDGKQVRCKWLFIITKPKKNPNPFLFYQKFKAIYNNILAGVILQKWKPIFAGGGKKEGEKCWEIHLFLSDKGIRD